VRTNLFVPCVIVLATSALSIGCKNDGAAVNALSELTTQLSEQVAEGNAELASLGEELAVCVKDLANTKGEAVVVTATDVTVETPSLEGEANLASLEALKQALNDTLTKQKAALSDLTKKVENCGKDLGAAQEEAAAAVAEAEAAAAAETEAAAAADAAEAEAQAKKAAARKKRAAAKKKPTAVKEAEEQGTSTKGVRSRY